LAGPYGFKPKDTKYRNVFANLDDYRMMQPLHFASGAEPPMLLLHGKNDTTVLPVNTRKFADKINQLGGDVQTKLYDERGHVGIILAFSRLYGTDDPVRSDVFDFLEGQSQSPSP
jgi:dipeptidyl aminopeptidase/acylaminoacyl peptidase